MKKINLTLIITLVSAGALSAQIERQRPEPNYEELMAHLGIDEAGIACLQANKEAFRETASPTGQELRDLQRQLRQATRDGADTTAIQADIDAAKSTLAGLKTTAVAAAQGCVADSAALAELVAAETLMNEVRQAGSLLLLESTEERNPSPNAGRNRNLRGGPPQGRR